MRSWIWILAIGALVVIGGVAVATGMLMGRGGERNPRIERVAPTPEERELQKIKIAASIGELVEARRGPQGWVVRVKYDSRMLDRRKLEETAVRFFRELDRADVPIAESSFEVRTDALKDVWGNTLPDTPIFRVGMGQQAFQKVNWRGIVMENLERVSDEYWFHDVLKAKEQEGQAQQGGGGSSQNQQDQGGSGQGA